MGGRRRTRLAVEAERRNLEQLSRLGADVRSARRARSLTQTSLGVRVGVGRMTVSRLERGRGGGVSLDAWQRIALAVGRPLTIGLQRAIDGDTRDAGHLAIQELVLRLGRAAGYRGMVELATTPVEPWRSIDVVLVDDSRRRLLVVECWNTIGDVGAAARSSTRKAVEAGAIAATRWGEGDHQVGLVWVIRATARNRAIVARYPQVFVARFPASSYRWARALTTGQPAPQEAGLVWSTVDGGRIFPWRR